MFFSIIIPCYNSEKTIAETLNSVINQEYKDFEVIIIDDCSDDNTINIINTYKSKLASLTIIANEKNIGVAKSRNKGFALAKGKYIALLDSDDLWSINKLLLQKKCIETTNCDICCTSYNFIDVNSIPTNKNYLIKNNISYNSLLKENCIGCSTVVINSKLLNDSSMNSDYAHEDYSLWLKLAKSGATFFAIETVLMHYRVSENSRSHNKITAAINRFKIYRFQEKLNIFKCIKYFLFYSFSGIKKYFIF